MKMRRRILSITLLMVLLIGISVSASASASLTKMFFRETASGYTCTGKGGLSGKDIAASFVASENVGQTNVAPDECYCTITAISHNSEGHNIDVVETTGSISATVSYASSNTPVYVTYSFTFLQHKWTDYTLYN